MVKKWFDENCQEQILTQERQLELVEGTDLKFVLQ